MTKIKPFIQTSSAFSLSLLSNSSSFILTALSVAGLKLVRYERLECGETTTTKGFDGRLFSFPVRATSTAIWLIRGFRPVWQARKRVSPVLKWNRVLKYSSLGFFIFPSSRLFKMEESKLVALNDWTLLSMPVSTWCLQCGLNKWQLNKWQLKCARCNWLKLQSTDRASPRLRTGVKSKPFSTHGRGLFSPVSKQQEKSLC